MAKIKLEIIQMKTAELTAYDRNAKEHTPEQIAQIAASIEEFGMIDPIAVWGKENTIVEGHGRLMACELMGIETVPVIRLDHLTDAQRKAYTLAHNKLTMNTGFDLEILSQELEDLQDEFDMAMFGFDPTPEEDPEVHDDNYEAAIPAEPISKPGEMYALGDHVLLIGDSTREEDVERLMGEERADCAVTDPPYNVAIENSQGMTIKNDDMGDERFLEFLTAAFENMARVMQDGAGYYVWYASRNAVPFISALETAGMPTRQQLIWVKNSFVLGRQDYQWQHEPCLYGWKDTGPHYFTDRRDWATVFDDADIDHMSKEEMKELLILLQKTAMETTVMREKKPKADDLHPTMKPITLLAKFISNSTMKDDTVLDLFGGSGSTLMACEQLGRRCRMMEYDPRYADVIIDRWEAFTGRKAKKIG